MVPQPSGEKLMPYPRRAATARDEQHRVTILSALFKAPLWYAQEVLNRLGYLPNCSCCDRRAREGNTRTAFGFGFCCSGKSCRAELPKTFRYSGPQLRRNRDWTEYDSIGHCQQQAVR